VSSETVTVLKRIDDALDWPGSDCSATWAAGFPDLNPAQAAVARQVTADTGVDGYTAWLMVTDWDEFGWASPFTPEVLAARANVHAETVRRWRRGR
jgi:hypothetical protein